MVTELQAARPAGRRVVRYLPYGALLIAFLAIVFFAGTSHGHYRIDLIKSKLRGDLPLGWVDTARMVVLPGKWWPRTTLTSARSGGQGGRPVLYETPLGVFFGGPDDAVGLLDVVKEQIVNIYERPPVTVRPGDVVLDIGAHLGGFTRQALRHGAALVIMMEPEPHNAECLEETFREEIRQNRVMLVKSAAWHSKGTIEFGFGGLTGTVEEQQNPRVSVIRVPTVTIDEMVAELKVERVDFIKMDIEGAERHALAGAARTIGQFGPRMALCIYHTPDDPVVIPKLARGAHGSYRVFTDADHAQAFFY